MVALPLMVLQMTKSTPRHASRLFPLVVFDRRGRGHGSASYTYHHTGNYNLGGSAMHVNSISTCAIIRVANALGTLCKLSPNLKLYKK